MDDRSRTPLILAGSIGATLAAFGLWALFSIPHSRHEFTYQNPSGGNAFWPLPFAPLNGFTPEQLSSHVARALFLFPACIFLGFAFRRIRIPTPARRWVPPLIAVSMLTTVIVATMVLRGVPLQDDDPTYLMQADLYTRGLVADPRYSVDSGFSEPFTIFTRAGMSGMYLFGAPLVLALGLPWGMSWLGSAALLALTLWAAYVVARRRGNDSVASLGLLLLAMSPMLTFTAACALSQTPALAGLAIAVLGLTVGGSRGGWLVGTGLGLATAARPQTGVPAGLVLLALYARRDRNLLAATLLAGLPWAVAIAVYNHAITGSPWQLPRAAYAGELESYGFGTTLRNYSHTPAKAIALAGVALVRLNGWGLGWPVSLAGCAVWFLMGRPQRALVGPWAAIAVATFLFQAGYPLIGTSETGAIYHHAALPFIAFSTAAALHGVSGRSYGGWISAVALVSTLLGTTSFYVEHGARLSRLADLIEGPRRSLDLRLPAVVIEDVWDVRPQYGWVFGIPFRERSPFSSIVRFPRPQRAQELARLLEHWPDRQCYYLWFEWSVSQYQLSPCSEIGTHDGANNPRDAHQDANLGLRPDGRPWFEEGGWRNAFPYLPR